MGWQKKAKEFFFNHGAHTLTIKGIFHLLTITVLSLLLPLSFLLLATLSGAQYYLQFLTSFHPQQPFPYIFTLALHINPCILYLLVSIVSIATLINGLMGKITLSRNSSTSTSVLKPHLYIAWILLCTFQVCVGLSVERSITAGVFDFSANINDPSFGVERSFLSRMIFLLGLHETTQVWFRVVVKPVVDDTVFGVGNKKERWIERVAVAASLGTLWWWRLKDEVETLAVVAEMKRQQFMDVGMEDFVGWWLYYLTVTIGMVRIVKGLLWIFMISFCRRRVTGISPMELELSQNDDKV